MRVLWKPAPAVIIEMMAEREKWQRRVALVKPEQLDPDLLEQRAHWLFGYVDRRDVVIMTGAR